MPQATTSASLITSVRQVPMAPLPIVRWKYGTKNGFPATLTTRQMHCTTVQIFCRSEAKIAMPSGMLK